jgi:hypothetical protein
VIEKMGKFVVGFFFPNKGPYKLSLVEEKQDESVSPAGSWVRYTKSSREMSLQ